MDPPRLPLDFRTRVKLSTVVRTVSLSVQFSNENKPDNVIPLVGIDFYYPYRVGESVKPKISLPICLRLLHQIVTPVNV